MVALWTIGSGLMVAVSPRAALVGVSSATGLLYPASFNVSFVQCFEVGASMLAGGLGAAAIGWVTHLIFDPRAGTAPPPCDPTGLAWARAARRSIRSGRFKHSVLVHHVSRLTTVTVVATVLYRVINPTDGFWISEAALFIGRPDATMTRQRSILRVVGSAVGVTITTLILVAARPSSTGLAVVPDHRLCHRLLCAAGQLRPVHHLRHGHLRGLDGLRRHSRRSTPPTSASSTTS